VETWKKMQAEATPSNLASVRNYVLKAFITLAPDKIENNIATSVTS
jgi:hypothetical protein